MSATEMQMTEDETAVGAVAMRTPLYLLISLVGVFIVICAFLPWASIPIDTSGEIVGGPADGFAQTITGLDSGGWGLAAIVSGVAIALLGVLGYFWNPFSDPEAMFIAGFGAVVALAALFKILDAASLFPDAGDFNGSNVQSRIGLWLVGIAGLDALLSGLWILLSRPKAEARLS